jgi:hypothetical protein
MSQSHHEMMRLTQQVDADIENTVPNNDHVNRIHGIIADRRNRANEASDTASPRFTAPQAPENLTEGPIMPWGFLPIEQVERHDHTYSSVPKNPAI